jgi:hypothetical protein
VAFAWWGQAEPRPWDAPLGIYRITPNEVEKRLGLFQQSIVVPEESPFKKYKRKHSARRNPLPPISDETMQQIIGHESIFSS